VANATLSDCTFTRCSAAESKGQGLLLHTTLLLVLAAQCAHAVIAHTLLAEHASPTGTQVVLAVRCMSPAQARVSTSNAASFRVAVHRMTVVLCLSKGGFAGALPLHEILVVCRCAILHAHVRQTQRGAAAGLAHWQLPTRTSPPTLQLATAGVCTCPTTCGRPSAGRPSQPTPQTVSPVCPRS
jgi:hypothetical protein